MNQRKQRQLSYLLRRIKNSSADESLITKAKSLFEEIKQSLSGSMLKRALTILGIGMAGSAVAQTSFLAPVINPFAIDTISIFTAPAFADLDNDGDLDLMMAKKDALGAGASFAFLENVGTASLPNFAAPQDNPFGLAAQTSVYYLNPTFVDLDNDGDYDIMAGGTDYGVGTSPLHGHLMYFENTGSDASPNFAAPVINPLGLPSFYYRSVPTFADIDNDGDVDLFVTEYYGAIQFFENTGTASAPTFGAASAVSVGIDGDFAKVDFADFDLDGDLDMVAIEDNGTGNLAYYENTGSSANPAWAAKQTNPFSFTPDTTAAYTMTNLLDLDADGDLDIFAGIYWGANIYYENNDPSASIIENNIETTVYPNPVTNQFTITVENDFPTEVMLFDNLGKQVLTWNTKQGNYDISGLSSGVYTLKMVFSDGISIQNIIKE
jgi:hypothetical protein